MTTIEITIEGTQVFCERRSRRLDDKEIRAVVRDGLIGVDKNKAVVTIKHE